MIATWLLLNTAMAAPSVAVVGPDNWIAGHRIKLEVHYTNPDAPTVTIPDLTNRPWLITFNTIDPTGTKRVIHSTPPVRDPGGTIALKQGETRVTRFEIPTSEGWSTGTASVSVGLADHPTGTKSIRIVSAERISHIDKAQPISEPSDSGAALLSLVSNGETAVFTQTASGLDWLATLTGTIRPELSIARSEHTTSRWITWTDETGSFWAVQQSAHRLLSDPKQIVFPWPTATVCGKTATANSGHLIVPLCIASPNGSATTSSVAIVSTRGTPVFRAIGAYGPGSILTHVNGKGEVEFILTRPNGVDWAWLGAQPDTAKPVAKQPVWNGNRIVSTTLTMSDETPPVPEVQIRVADTPNPHTVRSPR